MKVAVVSYDLKHVSENTNREVKDALTSFTNASSKMEGFNILSLFPAWIELEMPDTTLHITVLDDSITAVQLADDVATVIVGCGATPGRIYVAFIDLLDHFLWNSST